MTIDLKIKPYEEIKKLIKNRNTTQKKVAECIGMSRTLLNIKINRVGGRDFTTTEAKKLADYLNVKVDDFF
ncbi:helix-turn-helix domain-containing protein [Staphylococcus arlettae]|uniref:helix-turn-helix domain-containing protein n=1 Tax=Staphylococcus arlettae TaxID=29378 RepID=UPI001E587FC9|nr:helix-turn-helix transcriptional regulator [Staphylococcus arlettae]MCD8832721.1 helix-turn-helix domain-containing protein [Staphylococcus arlettae]